MTTTTLVTDAQLATAQSQANAIASSAKVVAPAATSKYLAFFKCLQPNQIRRKQLRKE